MDEKEFGKDINVRGKELTDEELVKDIERSTGMPSYWKKIVLDLIHRQKAEIERLTEERQKWFDASVDTQGQLNTVRLENAELQKQVDELTDENSRLNNCVMSEEQVRKCCADIIQETRQQAEKDTAKEIANWLTTTVNEDKNVLSRIIKECYGVEVEW